jgi:hypothetical protein
METLTIQQITQNDIRTAIRADSKDFFAENNVRAIEPGQDEIGGTALAMEITGLAEATIY